MNLAGVLNLLLDFLLLVLGVRAAVRNEGHMAFNRPYQFTVKLLDPLLQRIKAPERRVWQICLLAMLALVGVRGVLWMIFGADNLDFKVTAIPVSSPNILQCQLLSLVAASVFLLQVLAFLTLALAMGGLDNRTDHYSRLMRALVGPLKAVPPWWRCLFPALALVLFWSVVLWMLAFMRLHPPHPSGLVGFVLGSVPLTLALIVDLARAWIVLLIVRCVLSFIPVWRPAWADVIERVTEPLLKPFRRLPLRAGQIDFTPVVAILALAVAHALLLQWPLRFLDNPQPLLKWFYERI